MARPLKYQTQEERHEARLQQTRAALARFRAKRRQGAAASLVRVTPLGIASSTQPETQDAQDEALDVRQSTGQDGVEDLIQHLALTTIPELSKHSQTPIDASYPGLIYGAATILDNHTTFPHLGSVQEQGIVSRVAEIGVFAQWASHTGCLLDDNALIQRSRIAYSRVLRTMSLLVAEALKTGASSLLPAVLCYQLQSIEVVWATELPEPVERWNFMAHADAMPKVVQICGPKAFHSPYGTRCLRMMRKTMVFNALAGRETYLLDSDIWRKNPFADDGPAGEDKLWYSIEKIPGLSHRVATLAGAHSRNEKLRDQVLAIWQDILSLQAELQLWHQAFLVETDQALLPNIDDELFDTDLDSEPYPFPSIRYAKLLNAFWLYSFHLADIAREISEKYGDILSVSPRILVPFDPTTLAWRLCQTIHFLRQQEGLMVDTMVVQALLPLRLLVRYFEKVLPSYTIAINWCHEMTRRINEGSFIGRMADFIMECYYPPKGVPWERSNPGYYPSSTAPVQQS